MFHNVPNIAQAARVAVSHNPYMTSRTRTQPLVVMGIVLGYYCGGSLQAIMREQRLAEFSWDRWAMQIASPVARFHKAGETHMDIKPRNVVIEAEGNATQRLSILVASGELHTVGVPLRSETGFSPDIFRSSG